MSDHYTDEQVDLATLQNEIPIEQIVGAVQDLPGALALAPTPFLVDTFAGFNDLSKAMKKADTEIKAIIKTRTDEGMRDEKGNVFLEGTDQRAIKIERRVSVGLVEDAEKILEIAGVLEYFPRRPDPEKMLAKLRAMGIDPSDYSTPVIDKDNVEKLYEEGVLTTDTVKAVLESKESVAIKQHKMKKT